MLALGRLRESWHQLARFLRTIPHRHVRLLSPAVHGPWKDPCIIPEERFPVESVCLAAMCRERKYKQQRARSVCWEQEPLSAPHTLVGHTARTVAGCQSPGEGEGKTRREAGEKEGYAATLRTTSQSGLSVTLSQGLTHCQEHRTPARLFCCHSRALIVVSHRMGCGTCLPEQFFSLPCYLNAVRHR